MNGVFIHQQVKALQQLGVECHVLLLHTWFPPLGLHKYHSQWQQGHTQKNENFDSYEGVRIHHVPVVLKMPDRIFKNNYQVASAKAIVQYIRKNKELANADWLYAHFFIDSGYIGSMVKKELGIKLAVIARGDDIHAWPREKPEYVPMLHTVFNTADVLLANSAGLAHDTEEWMNEGSKRSVEVVYNGIDHAKFHPGKVEDKTANLARFGLDAGSKYLLCISTPVKLKGWIELLHAVAGIKEKFAGWKLLMVAPERLNDDALDLMQVAKELGIEGLVKHMGQQHPDDLAMLLRVCDAFVLPSYNEGMANSLLEAMASGLPCLATNVGGHSEVIENEVSGLLVPSKSVTELQNAIEKIITGDELRNRLGAAARKRMLEFGDYKHNASGLLSILNNFSKKN